MSKRTARGGRQYSIKLEDDMVEFALESTNVDSVSIAVRALIRKAMKEAPRFRRKPKTECASQNA